MCPLTCLKIPILGPLYPSDSHIGFSIIIRFSYWLLSNHQIPTLAPLVMRFDTSTPKLLYKCFALCKLTFRWCIDYFYT